MALTQPYYAKYIKIGNDVEGKDIIRPIIPVEFSYFKKGRPDAGARRFALIDSGADRCILNAEIAGELGIELESGIPYEFGGVVSGQQLVGYIHKVGITIGHFPMYTASIVFVKGLSDMNDCLLGEIGFFDHFAVKLDNRKKEIILKDR